MQKKKLSKSAMARKMNTSRSSLEGLLDPTNESVTLHTLKKAAHAIGRTVRLELA
jgi:transcriptional regulator with XRE-family HTH domain